MKYTQDVAGLEQYLKDCQQAGVPLRLRMMWQDGTLEGWVASWSANSGEQVVEPRNEEEDLPEISVDFGERSVLLHYDTESMVWQYAGEKQVIHTKMHMHHRTVWVQSGKVVTFRPVIGPGERYHVYFEAAGQCLLFPVVKE